MAPSPSTLVWPVALSTVQGSWDPDSSRVGWGPPSLPYHTIHLVYEPLTTSRVAIDRDGIRFPVAADPQPRLAEAIQANADFDEFIVRLRPDVRSEHGSPLTAASVKWSWERTYALDGVGVWRSRRLGGVTSPDDITILDDRTLRFQLSGPNPAFPGYLSFATNNLVDAAAVQVSDADPWGKEWLTRNTSGFGAFTIESRTDSTMTYRARPDYWAGRPGIDRIVQVGVTHREEAFRLLDRGEANFAVGLYPEEYSRFLGRPEFRVFRTRANHSTLEFDWRSPPFDDQRVRQAVCYALPYERILEQVYLGYARQSRSPVPSVCLHATGEFWRYQTDIERARELLASSPYRSGFSTALFLQPSRESIRFGEIVRQALKAIGIEVEVRLQTSLPFGRKAPMWFKEECGHGLFEAVYSLAHDYDPPPNLWGNKPNIDPMWTSRIRAIRSAPATEQPDLLRTLQRDLVEFATCAPIAELEMGWVVRGEIDPWALSPQFLGANTAIWSSRWYLLGWW